MKSALITLLLISLVHIGSSQSTQKKAVPAAHQKKSKHASAVQAQTPFACDMTVMTPDERIRHRENGETILGAVQEVRDMKNGYAFRLPADSAMISCVTKFIEKERLCCPFFGFSVEIEPEHGPLWLRITGRDGAKAFMNEEFGIDGLRK